MLNTEDLEIKGREAEDNGQEVYYERHHEYDVIEYIEIDGKEYYNPVYEEEVSDQYWLADAYRVAERSMY